MTTQVIISLVTVSAAALQIILFFKLWGMTKDVRKINEKIHQPVYTDINNVKDKLIPLSFRKEKIGNGIDNQLFLFTRHVLHAKQRIKELLNIIHEPMPEIIGKSTNWTDFNKFIVQGYDIYSKNLENSNQK